MVTIFQAASTTLKSLTKTESNELKFQFKDDTHFKTLEELKNDYNSASDGPEKEMLRKLLHAAETTSFVAARNFSSEQPLERNQYSNSPINNMYAQAQLADGISFGYASLPGSAYTPPGYGALPGAANDGYIEIALSNPSNGSLPTASLFSGSRSAYVAAPAAPATSGTLFQPIPQDDDARPASPPADDGVTGTTVIHGSPNTYDTAPAAPATNGTLFQPISQDDDARPAAPPVDDGVTGTTVIHTPPASLSSILNNYFTALDANNEKFERPTLDAAKKAQLLAKAENQTPETKSLYEWQFSYLTKILDESTQSGQDLKNYPDGTVAAFLLDLVALKFEAKLEGLNEDEIIKVLEDTLTESFEQLPPGTEQAFDALRDLINNETPRAGVPEDTIDRMQMLLDSLETNATAKALIKDLFPPLP